MLPFYELWVGEDYFWWVFAWFVKSVHVQLSYKTVDVMVTEILGQYSLLKPFNIMDFKLFFIFRPTDNIFMIRLLYKKIVYLKYFIELANKARYCLNSMILLHFDVLLRVISILIIGFLDKYYNVLIYKT